MKSIRIRRLLIGMYGSSAGGCIAGAANYFSAGDGGDKGSPGPQYAICMNTVTLFKKPYAIRSTLFKDTSRSKLLFLEYQIKMH